MSTTARNKPIRWTEDEEQKLALRFAELVREAELADKYLSFIGAVLQAQEEVLSVDRRRPKLSIQNSGAEWGDRFRKLAHGLLKAKDIAQAEEDRNFAKYQAQQVTREKSVNIRPTEIVQDVQEISGPTIIPPLYRVDEMISSMVDSVTENFRIQLRARLNGVINEEFEGIHEQISSELKDLEQSALNRISEVVGKVQGVANKRKVVVVGINIDQFNELEKEYGSYVKLDFVDAKKSSNRLKSAAQGADFVIANLASVSHHHSNILKHHPGLKRVNGGSGQVKDILLEICTNVH